MIDARRILTLWTVGLLTLGFVAVAPVKAPRSYPKSSLSMSVAGILGKSTLTIGSEDRSPQK